MDRKDLLPDAHRSLLERTGATGVEHDSHVPFLTHLVGVKRLLREWGAPTHLQDTGLFHSIYGTEFFDPHLEAGPNREEVRALIGPEAERLVWLWCEGRRSTIQSALEGADPATMVHRDGSSIPVTRDELRGLVELWCADAVEQHGRLTPEESDFSRGLTDLCRWASPQAQAAVAAVQGL